MGIEGGGGEGRRHGESGDVGMKGDRRGGKGRGGEGKKGQELVRGGGRRSGRGSGGIGNERKRQAELDGEVSE